MTSPQPMPTFISETAGADRGLICGFQMLPGARPREIQADAIHEALDRSDAGTWLHFNLTAARARRWLLGAAFLPPGMRTLLHDLDSNRRFESIDGGLVVVMNDFTFEDDSDPSEVAALWCYVS